MLRMILILLLLLTSCSKPYLCPERPIINTADPPVLITIEKGDLDCLDDDVKMAFWMFYRRVGMYIKYLHGGIEEYNKWAIEENKKGVH